MLKNYKRYGQYYLLLLPAFILLIIFSYYPSFSGLIYAFTNWDAATASWVGLDNFKKILNDRILKESVSNMLILIGAGLVIGNVPQIFLAELLFNLKNRRLSERYRFLFTLTSLVPMVVIMLIWTQLVLNPSPEGLMNSILLKLGGDAKGWFGDPQMALFSMILVGFPWVGGINFLIYLAGLQGIPESVLDASKIDGCGTMRRILFIDFPLIRSQLKFFIIMGIIMGIQGFGFQLLITDGGPGTSTMVPGMWMYKNAFKYVKFGYASSIGLVMFVSILIVTLLNLKFIKSTEEEVG